MRFLVGFRKFTVAIIFLVVSLGLLLGGVVTGGDFMKYNSSVIVAFMATNIGEHLLEIGKTWVNEKIIASLSGKHRP